MAERRRRAILEVLATQGIWGRQQGRAMLNSGLGEPTMNDCANSVLLQWHAFESQ